MSASLAEATTQLEKAFNETESRLDEIGKKVDAALLVNIQNPPDTDNAAVTSGVSVNSVLEEFHKVKADFKDIVKQVEDLKVEQQKFVDEITRDLKLTSLAVQQLQSKVGIDPTEIEDKQQS